MWKRIELHNHTIESDGQLTVSELVSYLSASQIHAFSLTDHNTISGWGKLDGAVSRAPAPMEYVRGYELTSYYGHLLCQNISSYIPWEDIDKDNADLLFKRVHDAGGLAGPAHPFSVPFPFSAGMGWSMKIHDFRLVDFIEIVNNAHPMIPDNKNGILWWEKLIFDGFSIAPTAGTDLHCPQNMDGFFTTFLDVPEEDLELPLSRQLSSAIKGLRTCITRGPVADWRIDGEKLSVFLSPGLPPRESSVSRPYLCQLRMRETKLTFPMENGCCSFSLSLLPASSRSAVIMVFEEDIQWENIVAVARPALFRPCS